MEFSNFWWPNKREQEPRRDKTLFLVERVSNYTTRWMTACRVLTFKSEGGTYEKGGVWQAKSQETWAVLKFGSSLVSSVFFFRKKDSILSNITSTLILEHISLLCQNNINNLNTNILQK